MNQEIRDLAERAGFHFYDMHDVDGQDLGESVEADSFSAVDKLVEAIVLKCAHICYHSNLEDSDIYALQLLTAFNIDNCRTDK